MLQFPRGRASPHHKGSTRICEQAEGVRKKKWTGDFTVVSIGRNRQARVNRFRVGSGALE